MPAKSSEAKARQAKKRRLNRLRSLLLAHHRAPELPVPKTHYLDNETILLYSAFNLDAKQHYIDAGALPESEKFRRDRRLSEKAIRRARYLSGKYGRFTQTHEAPRKDLSAEDQARILFNEAKKQEKSRGK